MSTYSDAILATTGLVSYWRLGESSGTSAADSKGTNTGTYTGGYTLGQIGALTGDTNTAVLLDGSSGYVSIPDAASLKPAVWSIETWVKPTAFGHYQDMYSNYASGSAGMLFDLDPTGHIYVAWAGHAKTSTATVTAGVWNQVVGTYDGTTLSLYINGARDSTDTGFPALNWGTKARSIGFDINGGYLNGVVDEVAFCSSTLSDATVLNHYRLATIAQAPTPAAVVTQDPKAEAVVRLQALDGAWETCGQDRLAGIVPENVNTSSNTWGSDKATFNLRRDPTATYPDLGAFTPCDIEIGGVKQWAGRVQETPTREGAENVINVQGEGWQYHLDDDVFQKMYVHTRLPEWKDARSFVSSDFTVYTTAWDSQTSDGQIYLALPQNAIAANNSVGGAVLDLGPNATAKRVVVTWKGGGTTANVVLFVAGGDTPGAYTENAQLSAATIETADTTGAFTFTTARRYVTLQLINQTGGNLTGTTNTWVRVSAALVVAATAYESGNASVLKAKTVVQDARDSATILLSSDNSLIDPDVLDTFAIPEFVLDGYKTPRDAITAVNAYHGWLTQVDVEKRLVFRSKPTAPVVEIGAWSGAEFEDASANNGEEIYNRVIVQGNGPDGSPLYAERTQAQQTGVALSTITSPAADNPSFATNTTSWTAAGTSVITRDTGTFDSTPGSGRWDKTGASDNLNPASAPTLTETFTGTFLAGKTYTLTGRVKANGGTTELIARFGTSSDFATAGWQSAVAGFNTFSIAWTPGATVSSGVTLTLTLGSTVTFYWIDGLSLATALPTLVDRRGFKRTKILPVNSAMTTAGANQIGDVFLANHKTTPLKGSLTVTGPGGVRRVLGGQPVHPSALLTMVGQKIRLSHHIDPDTGGIGRDGVIAAVSYDHDTQQAKVDVDSTRNNFESLLERLSVVVGS